MRVAHLIARLIIGGAQENTVLNCHDLIRDYGDEALLIAGPGLGPEGSLEADARARGIPIEIIPSLRRPIHPTRDVAAWRALARTIAKFQPDVVHTHGGKCGLFGRLIASRQGVRAIVHTVHGAAFHPYQPAPARAFFRQCEKLAAARCHAIISVADAMTEQQVAAGIAPREKFTTIYSGMEVEPFLNSGRLRELVRRDLGFTADDFVIAKVARLFYLKGHQDLVDAAKIVKQQRDAVKYLLVGDGILRPEIEARIAAAKLTPDFHFTGLVPPAQISELLAAADVVVHTSYREGLARVLPQAMLAGRPVISYDVDGAREVVVDGVTGCLLQAGDVAGLAARIVELSKSPEHCAQLGDAGRELCRTRFDHREMTRQIRALYQRLLA